MVITLLEFCLFLELTIGLRDKLVFNLSFKPNKDQLILIIDKSSKRKKNQSNVVNITLNVQ